jgi:hypothetical protein
VQVGIVERLGKFDRLLSPGVNCLLFPVEILTSKMSMRVQQLNVNCETKTLDNVFVQVVVHKSYRHFKAVICAAVSCSHNGILIWRVLFFYFKKGAIRLLIDLILPELLFFFYACVRVVARSPSWCSTR